MSKIEYHQFEPFIPPKCKYLLLGSFTAASLGNDPNYDWYYGSKRNQFWELLRQVYSDPLAYTTAKKALFTRLNLGIADIILSCERKLGNSLDANLTNIVINPQLESLLQTGSIRTVFFSSRFVENLFRKHFKHLTAYQLVTLPSPSPRYARLSKQEKVTIYRQLLPPLS